MGGMQMRRARVRVQWAGHGRCREFALIFTFFSFEPVGVHVIDRGQADTMTTELANDGKGNNKEGPTFAYQHLVPP